MTVSPRERIVDYHNETKHHVPLFLLSAMDVRRAARQLSCTQEIASDGFFSLGMLAEFDRSLEEHGSWFYRNLFWEAGAVGQVLYLEAEAAGCRGTGIGCYFDEAVHEVLGIGGRRFQSLYHFTVGMAVDDPRLLTRPGYAWEMVPGGAMAGGGAGTLTGSGA
ncbi:MAG: SagB/ThcOx family dehydrogenase [Acidobacteriota bacterium]